MGEVYEARDTRLGRTVAIKVLPEGLAASAKRLRRFEREARAISNLQHPHVCTLHDIGEEESIHFLVMEHCSGETLAERLKRGALSLDDTLRYGAEIAEALHAAHRRGIVHRDLKPGNIMLTPSGVKLLDFGLARMAATEGELGDLPTLTMSPDGSLTVEGTVLGTYPYMAPEQLEGKEADARSDIFALGCVLYEMATGKCAFVGESRASVIGAILNQQPEPIATLAPSLPPTLDLLVRTCLAKDPERRFQDAQDVKLQLQWIAEGSIEAGTPQVEAPRRKRREALAWTLCSLLFLAVAALFVRSILKPPRSSSPVRFTVDLPGRLLTFGEPRISPDGRNLAFLAQAGGGKWQVWIRPLDALDPYPVPGTEGAASRPFWSPDSRQIAFFANGTLQRVGLAGALPQRICPAPFDASGTWGRGGTILFDGASLGEIREVPAKGGVARVLIRSSGVRAARRPYFLPDGRHFLYHQSGGSGGEGHIMLASVDSKEEPRELVTADSNALFAPPDYLLFVRTGTLMAQPFDLSSLETTGEPVPIVGEIASFASGWLQASVSDNGTLAYRAAATADSRLLWVDREGKEISVVGKPGRYRTPVLSSDGTRLAVGILDSRTGKSDIWIRDLARGATSRLTFSSASDYAPIWSPDGNVVAFTSERSGLPSLWKKRALGKGVAEELWAPGSPVFANDWSHDGRLIAVSHLRPSGKWGVWIVPADGKSKPFAFVADEFDDLLPVFSPDGRYVAYSSDETGRSEIYLRSFPSGEGKWQVSVKGGFEPHWSANGNTIYYRREDGTIVAAPVTVGEAFSVGVPRELFRANLASVALWRNLFIVADGGQRFLLVSPFGNPQVAGMTVVLNWPQMIGR